MIHLKPLFVILTASLLIISVSCSTTRKITTDDTKQDITVVTESDKKTLQQSTDATSMHTSITDLSNIVIEFERLEYTDGAAAYVTLPGNTPQTDTLKQDESKDTDSNIDVAQHTYITSVTKGRVVINTDKQKQTDANIVSNQNLHQSDVTAQNAVMQMQSEKQVIERTKFSVLHIILMTMGVMTLLLTVYVVFRILHK